MGISLKNRESNKLGGEWETIKVCSQRIKMQKKKEIQHDKDKNEA